MKHKTSVTIGIPTYLGGEHLVSVLSSIYQKSNLDLVDQVLIAVDGKIIDETILKKIKNRKLKIIYFRKRAGQSQRMNDLMKAAKTDILILSNDDVIFNKDAVKIVLSAYKATHADLIAARVYPLKPRSRLERLLEASENIKEYVINSLPNQESYLTNKGRFMVLTKKLYKKIVFPKSLVNSDAYLYFFVIKNRFKLSYVGKIVCHFREPSTLREYINQVYKFQISQVENSKYFNEDFLKSQYKIPLLTSLKANVKALIENPSDVLMYYALFVSVRVINQLKLNDSSYISHGYWKSDISTKSL